METAPQTRCTQVVVMETAPQFRGTHNKHCMTQCINVKPPFSSLRPPPLLSSSPSRPVLSILVLGRERYWITKVQLYKKLLIVLWYVGNALSNRMRWNEKSIDVFKYSEMTVYSSTCVVDLSVEFSQWASRKGV